MILELPIQQLWLRQVRRITLQLLIVQMRRRSGKRHRQHDPRIAYSAIVVAPGAMNKAAVAYCAIAASQW